MQVNELTGEVTAEIGGVTFRLHATMPRLADFQAALGVPGFAAMDMMLDAGDARAAYFGLKHLCTSGNAALLDSMVLVPVLPEAVKAIRAALIASLPEPSPEKKDRAAGATRTRSRGRVSGRSPASSGGTPLQ